MIDGFVNVCENRSSVSGVQRPGMLPTSPSVQPDPMPAMSPVSPEVGLLGGELGGAMDAFFYLERHGYVAILMGKSSNKMGNVHGFSGKPCLISDISGWHVFFYIPQMAKLGTWGMVGWVCHIRSTLLRGSMLFLLGTREPSLLRCWLFCTVQHPFLRHPGFYTFQDISIHFHAHVATFPKSSISPRNILVIVCWKTGHCWHMFK